MIDPTESTRRKMVETINDNAGEREELVKLYGDVWNTEEVRNAFDIRSFMAPYVRVIRKSDGVPGTLLFQHSPRFYYTFQEDR
jgi:hypothetical protein